MIDPFISILLLGTLLQKTSKPVRNGMRKSRCIVSDDDAHTLPTLTASLEQIDPRYANHFFSPCLTETSSIAPPVIVQALTRAKFLSTGSKVILVSSESGSITLRHESEGGGNYGHHASKAALNMVGKLLSLDLKEQGVIVSIVHPGFMRTEMTRGVGFDKFWDDGGAVTPDEAASSLVEWAAGLDIGKTGQYWAPRGPRDIGTAEAVLGKGLPKPLQLPW